MRLFLCCLFYCLICSYLKAQHPASIGSKNRPEQYFDLILVRGSILNPGKIDTAILSSPASGSLFIGSGIRIPVIKKLLHLHLQPGFSWTRLVYEQQLSKRFPNSSIFDKEKHSLFYGEFPIGLQLTFPRQRTAKTAYMIEGGGYAGYLISGSYITLSENALGQQVRQRIRQLRDTDPLRYGVYGRIGYGKLIVQVNYRLSPFFDPFRTEPDGTDSHFRIPEFSQLELGIGIKL